MNKARICVDGMDGLPRADCVGCEKPQSQIERRQKRFEQICVCRVWGEEGCFLRVVWLVLGGGRV